MEQMHPVGRKAPFHQLRLHEAAGNDESIHKMIKLQPLLYVHGQYAHRRSRVTVLDAAMAQPVTIGPANTQGAGPPVPQEKISRTEQMIVAQLQGYGYSALPERLNDAWGHVIVDVEQISNIRSPGLVQEPGKIASGLEGINASVQVANQAHRGQSDRFEAGLIGWSGWREKVLAIGRFPITGISNAEWNGSMSHRRKLRHELGYVSFRSSVEEVELAAKDDLHLVMPAISH